MVLIGAALVGAGWTATPAAAAPAPTLPAPKTFVYTGGEQTYTVPATVVLVSVRADGGFGGPAFNQGGGQGEDLTAYLPVTPQEKLYTEVGQNGSGGGGASFGGGAAGGSQSNGLAPASSGGGATDVRTCREIAVSCPGGGTSAASRVIVAGGGGGAGGSSPSQYDACGGDGGAGGANGNTTVTTSQGTFVLGIDGTAGTGSTPSRGATNLGPGAGGVTGSCGDYNVYSGSVHGNAGAGTVGGSGGNAPLYGGGGGGAGGGYFGGGGGASGNTICNKDAGCFGGSGGAGGAGGSSFITAAGSVVSLGGAQGTPLVTYTPEMTITAPTSKATYTLGQVVNASYFCDPAIFLTCTGTVANGQPIDTSTAGAHTFVIQGAIYQHTVSASVTYTVVKRTTSTTVTCTPSSVLSGQPTTCTAVVADISPDGTPSVPTGRVAFNSDAAGTFNRPTCTLVALDASSAQCTDGYVPSAGGTQTITAKYSGDAHHKTSTDTTTITVG
jgi:hypothetical protein